MIVWKPSRRRARDRWLCGIGAVSLIGLIGCEKSPTANRPPDAGQIAKITVTSSQQFLRVGEVVRLAAAASDAAGKAVVPPAIVWTTGDSAVATVGTDGTVTAIAFGTVAVTATANETHGAITLVVERPASAISIVVASDLLPHDTLQLRAIATDSVGTVLHRSAITWTLPPSDFFHSYTPASIDSTGRVIATTAGTFLVSATSGTAHDTAAVYVHQPVATMTSSVDSIHVSVGSAWRVTVVPHDSSGAYVASTRAYGLVSSDSSVAIPDPPSLDWRNTAFTVVRTVGPGHAIISSTVPGVGPLVRVTVETPKFIQISSDGLSDVSIVCGLTATGDVWCWGYVSGVGLSTWTVQPPYVFDRTDPGLLVAPALVASGMHLTQISADVEHLCGIDGSGTAYCVGSVGIANPAIGLDYANAHHLPVTGGVTFASVSAGLRYTCGVSTAGAGYCWGVGFDYSPPGLINPNGVLGTGSLNPSLLPAPVAGGLTFANITAGYVETCGVTTDAAAYCWGKNLYGSLGMGVDDGAAHSAPERVAGSLAFSSIALGQLSYSPCGLTTAGKVYCWGAGFGAAPVPISGDRTFTALSVAASEVCALDAAGAAYCWAPSNPTPAAVPGGLSFKSITTSYPASACGLTHDDAVYCWSSTAPTPVRVPGQ